MKIKILFILLFLPIVAYAYVSEKTKRVTVGSSFTISPWSERGSDFSGYTCTNTYITGDVSAFTINETSRTATSYTSPSGIQHGYYATYSITAIKAGTYTLYAGSQCIKSTAGGWTNGNPVVKYNIIVSNPVAVSGISLDVTNACITVGENLQLQETIVPNNATNKNVTWDTSNNEVAIVDEEGLVTGVGIGSCQITATAKGNSNIKASCTITVSNSLSVNKITSCKGTVVNLPINMSNTEAITAFQFEIELPEGVIMTESTLSYRKSDQSVSYSQLASGNYQVTALSATNTPFSGNEGTLINLKLSVAEDMIVGNYSIQIKNIELTTATKAINPGNCSTTLTITDILPGDTDGNGNVSIFDAVQVVNYILGNSPTGFIEAVADMDGNGKITIFDAVSIVNIILNKND